MRGNEALVARLNRGVFGFALAFALMFGGSPAVAVPKPTEPTSSETISSQFTGTIDIKSATVKVDSQIYTGSKLEPVPKATFNKSELKADKDFTCAYKNNTKVGTATVVITGAGSYTGVITAAFEIEACPVDNASFTKIKDATYTGKAIKPTPTVSISGHTLAEGTDYTLSYKDNTNAGTATVTIKGKGNYKGSTSVTFKISKASVSKATVAKISEQAWNGKARKPNPKVTLDGKTLKKDTDYTLAYENNVEPGSTATVTIKGKGNYTGTKEASFKVGPKVGKWKSYKGNWWYEYGDGSYLTSTFEHINDKWYYFNADGYMVKGWCSVDGTWYYMGSDGAMLTGWQEIDGNWYYFKSSGAMAHGGWEGNYYLGSDGVMLTDTTTPDGYHVGSDGAWIKNWRAPSTTTESYGATVYWTPNGEVWHSTPSCPSLSRSKTIYSGTVAESGKSRGCKRCT